MISMPVYWPSQVYFGFGNYTPDTGYLKTPPKTFHVNSMKTSGKVTALYSPPCCDKCTSVAHYRVPFLLELELHLLRFAPSVAYVLTLLRIVHNLPRLKRPGYTVLWLLDGFGL